MSRIKDAIIGGTYTGTVYSTGESVSPYSSNIKYQHMYQRYNVSVGDQDKISSKELSRVMRER